MDSNSVHRPLLSSHVEPSYLKKTIPFVSLAKWVLKVVMWVVFVSWVALIFLYPAEFVNHFVRKCIQSTRGTVFGITGSFFLLFSVPVLLVALLSAAYLIISGEKLEFYTKKTLRNPSLRWWTFPIIVSGPFGVVSAAEVVGILLFVAYVIWAIYAYTLQTMGYMSDQYSFKLKSILLLEILGLRLGTIGMFCLAFLFLPVARGSVLLRLIDIPFEHATRYHVWLGHLTMLVFTLHGLFYVIAWQIEGNLLQELLEWKDIGIVNLAGVISLLAGLLMWVTSLPPVRKMNFELFFYTHQLYVVFVVFLALHVGDFIFCMAAGGIFIFMLDRFLRFCQSRRVVHIVSAKCLPCGTVELVLSKPASLQYNALSFVFLQLRELSWLQWHPFSVSSSPLDGKHHMSILIKVLGKWTAELRDTILNSSENQPATELLSQLPSKLTASVEGPYGHELPYYLTFENLILVAGGIGITPFLAILRDVLHRVVEGKHCLPKNILIIWAVKKSTEISLFLTLEMELICSSFSDEINLEACIYVTRESAPPLEEGELTEYTFSSSSLCPMSKSSSMSILVGTGHKIWSGLYVIASTIGFIILIGLLDVLYINPFHIKTWWYKGLLFMACMIASILIFGGLVVVLWHFWERHVSTKEEANEDNNNKYKVQEQQNDNVPLKNSRLEYPANIINIKYGVRPDFKDIFEDISKSWGHVDIGVMVCGPSTLETSVAKEIRSHNMYRERHDPIFHFNSHSFDL